MMWLPDETVHHLRAVADQPDLSATKYRIIDRIGRGGMATVYRAHDVELDRDIALKVLHAPELDPAIAPRMAEEARILAGLEHPGIVPVHDVGKLPDGRVFYAMKLVRGKTLDQLAAETRDLNQRLRVFQRICEPVAFAHAHGVLHRDLKPRNIMVGSFGEVLVMDWGIAKRAGSGGSAATADSPGSGEIETLHGTRVGTPGWMAPEQELGQTDRIDMRTDVYGLGAILRWLLGLQHGSVAPGTSVPPRLRAIAVHATASQRESRYASVEDLISDLRRFQDGLPVSAYRESIHERVARFAGKYRTAILLVLSYLVVRILLIAFARL